MMDNMLIKICTGCDGELPATNEYFHRSKTGRFGLKSECKECSKIRYRQYHIDNRVRIAKNFRLWWLNTKTTVISHYGGKCSICGEPNLSFLTIDHINGGGREHRRKIGGSNTIYRWLVKNNFPSGFQVLCHNCNFKKEIEYKRLNYINSYKTNAQRRHNCKVKLQVISYYGGKCQCCGNEDIDVLTIDHINGGGTKHRKEVGGGIHFYKWLIKNNFPEGFQVLCWNCNCGKFE